MGGREQASVADLAVTGDNDLGSSRWSSSTTVIQLRPSTSTSYGGKKGKIG